MGPGPVRGLERALRQETQGRRAIDETDVEGGLLILSCSGAAVRGLFQVLPPPSSAGGGPEALGTGGTPAVALNASPEGPRPCPVARLLLSQGRGGVPLGIRSTRRTRLPAQASAEARFTAVVVLPTPPFWFTTAQTSPTTADDSRFALKPQPRQDDSRKNPARRGLRPALGAYRIPPADGREQGRPSGGIQRRRACGDSESFSAR